MSVKKFKFVSPGIFIKEVDESYRTPSSPAIGPVIIGRASRGPAMRPIRVESFGDYVKTFGNPVSGFKGGDLWRLGNIAGPTYGAFAAQAYLAAQVGPVNVMRLLGTEHDNRTSAGLAGWTTTKTHDESPEESGGAFGLFLINSSSALITKQGSSGHVPGCLGAVWYLNEGRIVLDGTPRLGSADITGSAALMRSMAANPADNEFRAEIYNAAGALQLETNFNFNKDSDLYIRKVFNTNPQKTNSAFTATGDQETYWLGQSYDQMVKTTITGSTNKHNLGFIAGLARGSYGMHDQNMGFQNGKTGWFVSQDSGVDTSFQVKNCQKLFRLVGLDAGTATQRQFKVSIEDIKASPNADVNPYGSFSVVLRSLRDTDNKVVVIERFSNCNLDANSANYVAKKIGDMYLDWDYANSRYREYGDNPNNSVNIRVEMNEAVSNGQVSEDLLPFGVLGAPRPVSWRLYGSIDTASMAGQTPRHLSAAAPNGTAEGNAYFVGGTGIPHPIDKTTNSVHTYGPMSASIHYPALMMRSSSLDGGLTDDTQAYFGVWTNRSGSTSYDESVVDFLLPIDENLSKNAYDPSAGVTDYSYQFSLDDLAYDNSLKCMNWVSGSRALGKAAAGSSYTARSGSAAVLSFGYDRFTTVFYGGFDGLDITEMEPFGKHILDSGDKYTNYAYNTVHRAIQSVSDPEFLEMNVLAAPGVRTPSLTKYMTEVCEERGDALAVIDLVGDYTPRTETTDGEANRRGTVASAVSSVKSRLLDTSYGCCYYPWVQIRDNGSDSNVWVPPSVVALGVFASSERSSAVWFAPAGFNRGGLSDGAAGVPVISARQRLTRKDRDDLYEVNINPIAKFPNEGLVIFGQKTLQARPSALDRVNVRRLMIYLKKEISRVSTKVLFDNNVSATWERFKALVEPILATTKSQFGLTEYRLILDETTTTPDLIDQNILYAKIMLKPARAIEYIAIDFNIMPTGASFDD